MNTIQKYTFIALMAVAVDLHAQYCPSPNPNSCNSGYLINHFSTSLGVLNISNLNSGCSVGAYSYISNQKIITSPGAFFEIMIQSGQFQQGFACWIDWNKNFDFSDTLEDVWNSVFSSTSPFYGTINVPGNVPYGKDFRMRLRSSWSTPPTSPCFGNLWGEIEDYNVWVLAQYPHDAGIVSINSPNVNTCNIGNTVPISIELENLGNDTLYSCTIDWWVNSVQQTPYSWAGTIAPYNSLNTPNFATYNFSPFDTLKIITSNPNGQNDIMSFNDTIEMIIFPALSGIFTIGPGGDYPDFTSAVNDLDTYGVCDSVLFIADTISFNEQIILEKIIGASVNNHITFKGTKGQLNQSRIYYAPTSSITNYVVKLNQSEYVKFDSLIIENADTINTTAIVISGGTSRCTFSNNIIVSDSTIQSTQLNNACIQLQTPLYYSSVYNKFINNTIMGGSYGFHANSVNSIYKMENAYFENNFFTGQYYMQMYLNHVKNVQLIKNKFYFNSTYLSTSYQIYINNSVDSARIEANHLITNKPMGQHNIFYMNNVSASNAKRHIVSNNFFTSIHPSNPTSIIGINLTDVSYTDILHNSISILSNSTNSFGIRIQGNKTNNQIISNNIYLPNIGTGLFLGSSQLTSSDFNNIYSLSGNIGNLNGQNASTLAAWKIISGKDANSISVDPIYSSSSDLHSCQMQLSGAGKHMNSVLFDIDGQPRNPAKPYIGADVFMNLNDFLPNEIKKCTGDSILLEATSVPNESTSNLWQPGSFTSPAIHVLAPGVYYLTVTTGCGTATDSVLLTDVDYPISDFSIVQNNYTQKVYFYNSSLYATSYFWDFGDGTSSTLPNPSHTYQLGGAYTVTLVACNSCGCDTSLQYITGLDIKQQPSNSETLVYPNPTNGECWLQIRENDLLKIQLLTIEGRLLYNEMRQVQAHEKVKLNFDVGSGVYLINISGSTFDSKEKLIIH